MIVSAINGNVLIADLIGDHTAAVKQVVRGVVDRTGWSAQRLKRAGETQIDGQGQSRLERFETSVAIGTNTSVCASQLNWGHKRILPRIRSNGLVSLI